MAEPKEVVRMYRRILKLVQRYPSIKREAIARDIRAEFHENKTLTDAQTVREKVMAARAGIQELSQYASLHASALDWRVEVGRDALPTPEEDDDGGSGDCAGSDGGSIRAKTVGGKSE